MLNSRTDYHKILLNVASEGKQKEYIQAWIDAGESSRAAGRTLGIDNALIRQAVRRCRKKAVQQAASPDHDLVHDIPEGMRNRGQSIKYDADGNIMEFWNKSAIAGREPEEAVQIPNRRVVKTATMYDAQGKVGAQWVTEKPEDQQREAEWIAFAKELAAELPRVEPATDTNWLKANTNSSLMTVYPVGDHHVGMLAWDKENADGKDYDLKIAESHLMNAMDYLVDRSPVSKRGLILFLGDFMHYDSWMPVTPEHKNLLDADSRAPKMIRVAVRLIRYAITRALQKHEVVDVGIEIGNHDPYSAIWMMESLNAIYENEPRVSINTSPMHYHYWRHGKVLIGTHHGHQVKPEKLPLIMASDKADWWGQTKHRVWHTGHVHHDSVLEFNGCKVEKHRILAPADAYASQKGYRSGRDMKAIVYHDEHGEVSRYTVNPEMFS